LKYIASEECTACIFRQTLYYSEALVYNRLHVKTHMTIV